MNSLRDLIYEVGNEKSRWPRYFARRGLTTYVEFFFFFFCWRTFQHISYPVYVKKW